MAVKGSEGVALVVLHVCFLLASSYIGFRRHKLSYLNSTWMSKILGENVLIDTDDSISGGLSGTLSNISLIETKSGLSRHIVLKTEGDRESSCSFGLAREAFFYNEFYSMLPISVAKALPEVYFSDGSMLNGSKVIIMECLESPKWICSGVFFGPGSPLNWGKDLDAIVATARLNENEADPLIISEISFLLIAQLHANFWCDESMLLDYPWLHGVNWLLGEGRSEWEASMRWAREGWSSARDKLRSEDKIAELCVQVIDASLAKTTWPAFRDSFSQGPLTLIHGDFHPHNMMWNATDKQVKLLDWEAIGVGNGPREIAQFLISHVDPEKRRQCELTLLEIYYNELTKSMSKSYSYSWEHCLQDYIEGGIGRWVWLIGIISAIPGVSIDMLCYFRDQMGDFIVTHGIIPETAPLALP